jgi:hypothetical protein
MRRHINVYSGDLRSPGILGGIGWQSVTDVSREPVGPNFRPQEVQGTDKPYRNVGNQLLTYAA